MDQKDEVLATAKEILREELPELRFNTWIKPMEIISLTDEAICLGARTQLQKSKLESDYSDLVRETFKMILNIENLIVSVVDLSESDSKTQFTQNQPIISGTNNI